MSQLKASFPSPEQEEACSVFQEGLQPSGGRGEDACPATPLPPMTSSHGPLNHTQILAALGKPWSPAPEQTREIKQFAQNESWPVEGACSWQLTPTVRGSTPSLLA